MFAFIYLSVLETGNLTVWENFIKIRTCTKHKKAAEK